MITLALDPHPNEVAAQLTGRDYISYSAISTFRQCPLRYKFRYIDGLPEETVSASLAFGGGIHAAIEHWFNERMAGAEEPDHDTMLAAFWASWHGKDEDARIEFGKREDISSIGALADRVLKTFRQSEAARPDEKILGVEEELRGPIIPNAPDLLARIDLLTETDDALTITDFKTARSRWSAGQADENAEQLFLYGELAGQLAPGKRLNLQFAVVTKTKEPSIESHVVEVDPRRMRRTKRIVGQVWRAIQASNFYPAPSPMNCATCPFRKPCSAWPG